MIRSGLKICPFSKEIPTLSPIPGTTLAVELYPSFLKIFEIKSKKVLLQEKLPFGPVIDFTVFLDLEKFFIKVLGFCNDGALNYEIRQNKVIFLKPCKREIIFENPFPIIERGDREKLSFGVFKSEDITLIRRRRKLEEILPLWFYLSQSFPKVQEYPQLEKSLIENGENLIDTFLAGFTSLFLPRLVDDSHLGYPYSPLSVSHEASPLLFLQKSYPLLRRLFFYEEGKSFYFIVKNLIHSGKMVNVKSLNNHEIEFEWSNKKLRRIFIKPFCDDSIFVKSEKSIKRFRVTINGKRVGIFGPDDLISLKRGETTLIDNFER